MGYNFYNLCSSASDWSLRDLSMKYTFTELIKAHNIYSRFFCPRCILRVSLGLKNIHTLHFDRRLKLTLVFIKTKYGHASHFMILSWHNMNQLPLYSNISCKQVRSNDAYIRVRDVIGQRPITSISFQLVKADGRTDGQTDGHSDRWTDGGTYSIIESLARD